MTHVAVWFTCLIVGTIRMYQRWVSPWLGDACRFVPTCSEYACRALTLYGPVYGLLRAGTRISRCHPFHPGGFDPV